MAKFGANKKNNNNPERNNGIKKIQDEINGINSLDEVDKKLIEVKTEINKQRQSENQNREERQLLRFREDALLRRKGELTDVEIKKKQDEIKGINSLEEVRNQLNELKSKNELVIKQNQLLTATKEALEEREKELTNWKEMTPEQQFNVLKGMTPKNRFNELMKMQPSQRYRTLTSMTDDQKYDILKDKDVSMESLREGMSDTTNYSFINNVVNPVFDRMMAEKRKQDERDRRKDEAEVIVPRSVEEEARIENKEITNKEDIVEAPAEEVVEEIATQGEEAVVETVEEAPVVEEVKTEEPVVEEASAEEVKEAVAETVEEVPVVEEVKTEEPVVEKASAEEVKEEVVETVEEAPGAEEVKSEEPVVEETSAEEVKEEVAETVEEVPVVEEVKTEEPVVEKASAEEVKEEVAETIEEVPVVEEVKTEETVAEEAIRKEQERAEEREKEKARSNAEPEISRQVNSRKRIAYNNKTAKELRNQAAGYVRSMSDQEVLEELLTVNNRVKQLNEKNTRTPEEEVQLAESEILKRALENRAKKISQETNITQDDKEANTTVKSENIDAKDNSNNENERLRNQAQDLVREMSDETVMKRLAEAEQNIEKLRNSTMRTKEGENARNRVLAEWGILREALVERAKIIDNTQIVSETNIVNEDINRDETNVPAQPRARTTIRRNSVDEIPGMRELFDETGITDILDKQFSNGEERTEENAVAGTKTNSVVEEVKEPSKVEEPKQVEQAQTQNPNLVINMEGTKKEKVEPKQNANSKLKINMGRIVEEKIEEQPEEMNKEDAKKIIDEKAEAEQKRIEQERIAREKKKAVHARTPNPNLAINMGNTRIIPKKTDNERLESIIFNAKEGQYYVVSNTNGDFDREDISVDISESKKWLNPKNKQTWIEDKIGLDVANGIFDRIDKETIKKCDPFLLLTVYNFYNSREQKQKGIDFANDYLKALQGDKNTLGFKIGYHLQDINENEKIGLWDKLKLMKLAKNHRDNLNEEDIRVYAPQKTPKTSKSVDKDTNKRDKKKLPLWKRVALGMSAALMGVTGIALTAHQGAKMLNEGKDRNNGYVDDITLENDKTETGTTITTKTQGPETRTTTATTITTKDTTTKETTSKATTNETTYTTYTTEGNTTSTTTYIDNNNNQGQEGKNDFLEGIKVKPEDQSPNNNETVTVENEAEPLTLGTIFETLPKGLTFTEGMDGGRVGKVGSRATPEDGFYVIDRAVGVEDNALDYHSGLKGTKIKDNATMVHISYIQGAKTMEEAMEIVAENKNNKNWNSNGIGQRGWVKIETLKKIYEEQNEVKTHIADRDDDGR